MNGVFAPLSTLRNLVPERVLSVLLAVGVSLGLGLSTLVSPWAGLVLAMGILMAVLVLTRPILLGYLVIFGITITSGMARGRIIPFLIPNEAILVFCVGMSLPFILARKFRVIRPPAPLFIGIFTLVGGTMILPLVAYNLRGISLSTSEVIKLLASSQYILLAVVFMYLPANDKERFSLLRWMLICAGIVALVGLAQAARVGAVISFLQAWYPSNHAEASDNVQRVTSLLGVWNGLGTFLMFNMLILRTFQKMFRTRADQVLALVIFMLCMICLLASGSYAGLAGLVIGFVIIGYLDGGGLRELKIIALGMLVGIVPLWNVIMYRYTFQFGGGGAVPHTFSFRVYVWQEIFWPVIQKNWLWGYRPTIQDLAWQYPESIYFALMFSGGIFALLAHFGWLSITLTWLYGRFKSPDFMSRSLAIVAATILVVLSIMGFTNEVFTFSGVVDYLWIILGLLAGKEGLKHAQ